MFCYPSYDGGEILYGVVFILLLFLEWGGIYQKMVTSIWENFGGWGLEKMMGMDSHDGEMKIKRRDVR